MSINADYLNYLVNGGDFDSLPIPTSVMGIYLRQLCIKIDNLPVPMVFKGTLGTGGTITQLPTASKGNTGHTYKVITDGTYAGIVAIAGDEFISDGDEWLHIPSGNDPASLVDYDDTETQLGATNVQQAIEKLNSKPSGAGVDYSLDEVNTGIKWIDGKPIYRKVITSTLPSTKNQPKSESHNIENIEKIIKVDGYIDNVAPLCFYLSTTDGDYVGVTTTLIKSFVFSNELLGKNVNIIVEYTKTTD